jgi:hypothetical protein
MVEPFEVEQHADRFAHANVGKHRTARIEDQAGEDLRQAVGNVSLTMRPSRTAGTS